MPIKARCPQCKTVVNAPDAAAGKAVRCPKCSGKVPVGAGKEPQTAGKKKGSGQRGSDDPFGQEESVFANLNIAALEDRRTRVCPKCGKVVDEDDEVCPKCQVDIETGQLTERARRKQGMRGPDPDKYYENIWSGQMAFLKANKGQAIRTSLLVLICTLWVSGCVWMLIWCQTLPPKLFWGFLAGVAIMAVPGWTWRLCTHVVKVTIKKKNKLDKVHFDLFANMSQGVAWFLWLSAMFLLVPVIGAVLLYWDEYRAWGALTLIICIGLSIPLYPTALAHASMPQTGKGWNPFKVAGLTLKLFKPVMLWLLTFLVMMGPVLIGLAVIYFVWWGDVYDYFNKFNFNTVVALAKDAEEWKQPKGTPPMEGQLPPEWDPKQSDPHFWFRNATPKELDHNVLIGPAILLFLMTILYGPAVVYLMRGIGMFTYYFGERLELETLEKLAEWKPKGKKQASEEDEYEYVETDEDEVEGH